MPVTVVGDSHDHCLHPYRGFVHIVVPDSHAVLKCCRCTYTTTMHWDHYAEHRGARIRQGTWHAPPHLTVVK